MKRNIFKTFTMLLSCALCISSAGITAQAAENESEIMYCNPKVSWLRTEPEERDGNQMRHIYSDEYVYLTEITDNNWGYVTYPCDDGNIYTGYVNLDEYRCDYNNYDMRDMIKSELGLNDAAATAVYTNIYYESSGNFDAYCIDTNGLPSYGLCQWNGPRYENLKNYCYDNNLDIHTQSAQFAYLKHELETDYREQYDYMLSVNDTAYGCYDASYYWASKFEVCSSLYWEKRADTAYEVYMGTKGRLF